MKLVDGFRAWYWWWIKSYLSWEIRVDEVAASDGRWIPTLWLPVLIHDVCGGTMVMYADVFG
jgi:hypothetical protein